MSGLTDQYVWVDCRSRGWQVLMASESVGGGIPEPPSCVLERVEVNDTKSLGSPRSPRSPLQKSKVPVKLNRIPARPFSPKHEPDPDEVGVKSSSPTGIETSGDWEKSLNQYAPPPRRDFVENNKPFDNPTRKTKRDLLDEASRQLKESETLGSSLAERLAQLQHELKPS